MSGGRWAVITGSSSGLGYAMAAQLLAQGWKVAGGSRSGTDIEHENFYDLELDVTSPQAVDEFYRTLGELTQEVHLFIQNAGICEMESVEAYTAEQFERHLKTNTLGPFLMMQALVPFLINGVTHVVSVMSAAAKHAYPNVSAYNASKFGQRGFMDSLQKEWKEHKVRFSSLYPGAIDTPLWDNLGKEFSRERMLTIEDFLHVFDFVVNSPSHLRLADITFLHQEGFLE